MVRTSARTLLALGLIGFLITAVVALFDTTAPPWIMWLAGICSLWLVGLLIVWGVVYGGSKGDRR